MHRRACFQTSAWAGGAALFLATLAAYGPALRAGFVWDDNAHVTSAALRSFSGLRRIWSELGATQQYYPLLFSAFWLEHRLWADAAFGYHLTNVLLHATSAWLFVLVLRRLAIPGAWLAGFLFALHPVGVESVAWISEQKNTLSTVFYFAAALAYLRFEQEGRAPRWYAGATLLFVAALLSKTVAATLPAALMVVAWWQRGRLSWKGDVRPLVPWLGLGAAAGLFSSWVERVYLGAQGAAFALDGAQRLLLAGRAFWFYLGKLLWPAPLIFIYPRWNLAPRSASQWLFPLAALALAAVLFGLRRKSRAPLAALLVFAGSLFPTLGFFNVFAFLFSYVTDHWQYLASPPVIALAAAGAALGQRQLPPGAAWLGRAAGLALLAGLGVLTWRQCRGYRDPETFYRTTLARNPSAWMAHNNLGVVLVSGNRWAEGRTEFETALRLQPDYPQARHNLAELLVKQGVAAAAAGHWNDALADLGQALQLEPNETETHLALGMAAFHLANALVAAGRPDRAVANYEIAISMQPDFADAHRAYGDSLARLGRVAEARAQYAEALRLRPDDREARESEHAQAVAPGATSP